MNASLKPLLGGLAVLFLLAPAAEAQPSAAVTADSLGWMAGDWVEEREGQLTEESWMPPRGGVLLGMTRSGAAGPPGSFEFTRIGPGPDGVLSFNTQPQGRPPIAFPVEAQGAESISFLNRAHDYPQRIRYWRDGEALVAEISLVDGSKPVRWRFQRRR